MESLTANNYPANLIYNGRQLNRQEEVNDTDQRGMVILPYAKGLKESQKFFVASTSRSLISLFGQSQTFLKYQKTRSEKRLPDESCTRSNVKIVIVLTSVRHRALKIRVKEHAKAIATLDENSLLATFATVTK